MMRRESGLVRSCSTDCEIWSISRPSGAGQERHCLPYTGPSSPFASAHSSQMRDAVLAQVLRVGLAAQEPQQLVGDGLEVHALGGDQRETRRQVEAHLVTEHRERAGAGAIGLGGAVAADVPHEVEELFHGSGFMPAAAPRRNCPRARAGDRP